MRLQVIEAFFSSPNDMTVQYNVLTGTIPAQEKPGHNSKIDGMYDHRGYDHQDNNLPCPWPERPPWSGSKWPPRRPCRCDIYW